MEKLFCMACECLARECASPLLSQKLRLIGKGGFPGLESEGVLTSGLLKQAILDTNCPQGSGSELL